MITELSHTLEVKVIAEGVETREELFVLQKLKVDFIQGYLFSKPKPKPKPISSLNEPDYFVNKYEEIMKHNSNAYSGKS
jgi:EAL domain-containing protein (putative c-di-GMP-specific phosphodiesterase class I)